VLRCSKWEKIPGEMLLPGDVFSIVLPHSTAEQQNEDDAVMPADVLLIGGSCITDEAVLTGESTPQWKEAIAGGNPDAAKAFAAVDVRQDKLHVLFGGTKILSVEEGSLPSGMKTPDGGAPAVVLRTGFETAQGRLMRTILFSTERLTANTLETGLFICFLLIFAIAAAGVLSSNPWNKRLWRAGCKCDHTCACTTCTRRACDEYFRVHGSAHKASS
jgi:manganese-transporting P-type ATPase